MNDLPALKEARGIIARICRHRMQRRAHVQKQMCYASIGRTLHPELDPCAICKDENCPVRVLNNGEYAAKED